MSLTAESLEAILVAMLAVNSYGLEKAYALLPQLREAGLTDPENVANSDVGDVMVRMYESGYQRGLLGEMFAERVKHLMTLASQGELDSLEDFLESNQREQVVELLCQIKGVGPKVAGDVLLLMEP